MLNSIKPINIGAAVKKFTAALFLLMLAYILSSCENQLFDSKKMNNLVLYNSKTSKEIARFSNVSDFSIKFIHSVNKKPLEDFYEINNGKIYVIKTTYYDFGAGVQTELNQDEKFYYGENGELVIDNINKEIPDLVYVVGTYSDHILTVNKHDKISLIDLCGKNTHVRFQIE